VSVTCYVVQQSKMNAALIYLRHIVLCFDQLIELCFCVCRWMDRWYRCCVCSMVSCWRFSTTRPRPMLSCVTLPPTVHGERARRFRRVRLAQYRWRQRSLLPRL